MEQPSYINDAEEEASEPPSELPKLEKKDSPFPDSETPEKKAANATIQNDEDDDDDFERDENTTIDAAGSSTESKENKD